MTPDQLPTCLEEAAAAARRLQSKLRLSVSDHDDLLQELLLDLHRRLPRYDETRGGLGPFAGKILRNHASRISAQVHARRRRTGEILSFDADEVFGPGDEHVAEDAGLCTVVPQTELSNRNLALAVVLGRLDEDDRVLCGDLAKAGVADLVRTGRYSRSTLYRRIGRLRLRCAAWGLASGEVAQ